jgi:hypothetical protein
VPLNCSASASISAHDGNSSRPVTVSHRPASRRHVVREGLGRVAAEAWTEA